MVTLVPFLCHNGELSFSLTYKSMTLGTSHARNSDDYVHRLIPMAQKLGGKRRCTHQATGPLEAICGWSGPADVSIDNREVVKPQIIRAQSAPQYFGPSRAIFSSQEALSLHFKLGNTIQITLLSTGPQQIKATLY